MIVYIVTLNQSVQAAFEERDQAALYCAIREDAGSEFRVEEWDTEAIRITSNKPLYTHWTVCVNADGKTIPGIDHSYTFTSDNRVDQDFDSWVVTLTTDENITEEQVKELALERLKEWRNGLQRS